MPKVKTTPLTRKKSEEKYGGGPCDLALTDPSTYRQLIKYFYYLERVDHSADFWTKVQRVTIDLKSIWLSVNPRLPLISEKSIDRKIKHLLLTVKDINRKHAKANAKRNLDSKLDKLFDISACSCPLEIVPCYDSRIYCKKYKCTKNTSSAFVQQLQRYQLKKEHISEISVQKQDQREHFRCLRSTYLLSKEIGELI